jgi:hypothetical protein
MERQRLADGSWRVSCNQSMSRCVREVDRICGESDYEITSGRARLRSFGIGSLPNESWVTELVVRCAEPMGDGGRDDAAAEQ